MKSWLLRVLFISLFCSPGMCRADIAVLVGNGYLGDSSGDPMIPVADQFTIGQTSAQSLTFSGDTENVQFADVAMDQTRGTFLCLGQLSDFPSIFIGSVFSSLLTPISIPMGISGGGILSGAFDSDGNAIVVGFDDGTGYPLVLKISFGATAAVQISVPGTDEGQLAAVVMTPSNTALMGGTDYTTGAPLLYALPSGADTVTPITLPDPSVTGSIWAVAVGSDGTALFGGDSTIPMNGEALIYSLAPGSLSATAVSIPGSNDGGQIVPIAIGPDGSAILVGSASLASVPLIYGLGAKSTSSFNTAPPNGDTGALASVAIGSNGVAISGGGDYTTGLPLICSVAPGATSATLISPPDASGGAINCVAVGAQNVAVLGGNYEAFDQGLIFTLAIGDSMASAVSAPDTSFLETIYSVAVFSSQNPPEGLYNIERLKPYYDLQVLETTSQLRKAGL